MIGLGILRHELSTSQAEAEEVLAEAKAANSRRVAAFCEAQAAGLLATMSAQVGRFVTIVQCGWMMMKHDGSTTH